MYKSTMTNTTSRQDCSLFVILTVRTRAKSLANQAMYFVQFVMNFWSELSCQRFKIYLIIKSLKSNLSNFWN